MNVFELFIYRSIDYAQKIRRAFENEDPPFIGANNVVVKIARLVAIVKLLVLLYKKRWINFISVYTQRHSYLVIAPLTNGIYLTIPNNKHLRSYLALLTKRF